MTYTNGNDTIPDRTASYTIPLTASNNLVINITSGCNWCGPERIGWFSVQFWVRACYGKRKWMSVTQDWKKKVKYCPMCGRKLEVEG